MVAVSPLVSTVVMAVLLAVIVLAIAKQGSPRGTWIASHRRYIPGGAGGDGRLRPAAGEGLADSMGVWVATFLALVFGFGFAALALVGWGDLGVSGSLGTVFVGLLGLLLTVYLGVGIYLAARSRGHPYSMAAAQAATVLAMVALVLVTIQLVTT